MVKFNRYVLSRWDLGLFPKEAVGAKEGGRDSHIALIQFQSMGLQSGLDPDYRKVTRGSPGQRNQCFHTLMKSNMQEPTQTQFQHLGHRVNLTLIAQQRGEKTVTKFQGSGVPPQHLLVLRKWTSWVWIGLNRTGTVAAPHQFRGTSWPGN